jgi:hypothetical protein
MLTRILLAVVLVLAACSEDDGAAPCTYLEGDVLNANPVYTADGEPLVIMRLDLAGSCPGSGEETYIVWRSGAPEILTEPVAVHPMDLPENEPGTSMYLYRTHGLTIDIQRDAATDVTLGFIDGSGLPPALRCQNVDGFLSCEPV